MCEKLLLSVFRIPLPSLIPSFYLSLSLFSRHNRILLCFSGMCQNPVVLFRESVPSESAMGSVRVCACLRLAAPVCAWLRLSVPSVVRSALLSGPHPSQMVTRGGLQLTSNHTRVTYWKGSSTSLCLPKLRPCGVT